MFSFSISYQSQNKKTAKHFKPAEVEPMEDESEPEGRGSDESSSDDDDDRYNRYQEKRKSKDAPAKRKPAFFELKDGLSSITKLGDANALHYADDKMNKSLEERAKTEGGSGKNSLIGSRKSGNMSMTFLPGMRKNRVRI